jgi:hypothetical protein
LAACGGTSHPKSAASAGQSSASRGSVPAGTAAALTDSAGAQLYAALDQLLREYVDLTANVVETAVTRGPESTNTAAALVALDQNTQGLGAAIGSVYGSAAQAEFLKFWRAHIGFFVKYTLGRATHNSEMVGQVQTNLTGYISQFSAFVAAATKLPAAAVAADLGGHVSTLETVINDIVAGGRAESSDLAMAETHMAGTAAALAKGIVSSVPARFPA